MFKVKRGCNRVGKVGSRLGFQGRNPNIFPQMYEIRVYAAVNRMNIVSTTAALKRKFVLRETHVIKSQDIVELGVSLCSQLWQITRTQIHISSCTWNLNILIQSIQTVVHPYYIMEAGHRQTEKTLQEPQHSQCVSMTIHSIYSGDWLYKDSLAEFE